MDPKEQFAQETAVAKVEYNASMAMANERLEAAERPIRAKYGAMIRNDPERRPFLLQQMASEMRPVQDAYRAETAPIKERYARATTAARERMWSAKR
jgi:hypothetical protein